MEGALITIAFLVRTPASGGHWIALLAFPRVWGFETANAAALLCDSLHPSPYYARFVDAEDILTS